MSRSIALESLPPEIQLTILECLPDVNTLHTLLRSSPRLLQVFLKSKKTVLSNVARNSITPELLPLAVMVLAQRRQENPMLGRKPVLAFLKNSRQQDCSPIPCSSFSLETSKELLRFHASIERFVADFATSRISLLNAYLSKSRDWIPFSRRLSPVEHHRIARALYHMDLYGCLFHIGADPEKKLLASTEETRLFLQQLTEWELEELLCVQRYLVDKLGIFVQGVEDDVRKPHDSSLVNLKGLLLCYERLLWDPEEWEECHLMRGLRNLESILAAGTLDEKLNALEGIRFGEETTTLTEAMNSMPIYPDEKNSQVQREKPRSEFVDGCNDYNAAWSWAWEQWWSASPRYLVRNLWKTILIQGHRKWGYAIWDHKRLTDHEILQREPYAMSIHLR